MKVTYREQSKVEKYAIKETIHSFYCKRYWIPEGTDLYYFVINDFEIKTVSKENVITIENNANY